VNIRLPRKAQMQDRATCLPESLSGSCEGNLICQNFDATDSDWSASIPVGSVKSFNASRGYGSIKPAEGSADIIVQISEIKKAGDAAPDEVRERRHHHHE
jgi:hypothetical protein